MITGHHSTHDEVYHDFDPGDSVSSGSDCDAVLNDLYRRRENVLKGGVNCIPFPFSRFRQEIPGIEHEQYVIVTANAKVGKSQLTDFLYVFSALDYAFENPQKCSIHIIYFTLEESVSRITQRYMSHLLYKFHGMRISPTDLRSTSVDFPVPEEALKALGEEPIKSRLRFFNECVEFHSDCRSVPEAMGILHNYAMKTGTVTKRSVVDSFGESHEEESVYTPNDPNHFVVVLFDHMGLFESEKGKNKKATIDDLSERIVHEPVHKYKFTVVGVQQQASDMEGLEAVKQKRMMPSAAGLADSKYTARDANMVLGLFDPSKFGLASFGGYAINDVSNNECLRSYARFLLVLINRDGEMGGTCPLFFDGAVTVFEELPQPDDVNALAKYYARVRNMKSYRQMMKAANLSSTVLFILKNNKSNNIWQKLKRLFFRLKDGRQ